MKTWRALVIMLAFVLAPGVVSTACSDDTSAGTTATVGDVQNSYVTLNATEAYEQLSSSAEAQIVDVREPSEWEATGVPVGAALIPLGDLETRAAAELVQDDPVYVICNSGSRSQTGSQILIDLGYGEVYNVAGGIQAWLAEGLPVESYAQ